MRDQQCGATSVEVVEHGFFEGLGIEPGEEHGQIEAHQDVVAEQARCALVAIVEGLQGDQAQAEVGHDGENLAKPDAQQLEGLALVTLALQREHLVADLVQVNQAGTQPAKELVEPLGNLRSMRGEGVAELDVLIARGGPA